MSNLNNAHEGMDEMGDHLDAQQAKKAAAPQPVQTAEDELAEAALIDAIVAYGEACGHGDASECGAKMERVEAAIGGLVAALASKPVQGGELAGQWEGAEEWMPLAWELCANECGEEACTELIWEGGPIPEPWGDRWLKYEGQAKEMIAMVRKHVPTLAAQPVREPMWQPIETAPKDGRKLLLWWAGMSRVGRCAGVGAARDGGDWWQVPSLECAPTGRPTHWMPLPAAPGITKE